MSEEIPLSAPAEAPDADKRIAAELERRIADLELQLDLKTLSAEAKQRQLLISEIEQRLRIRWVAVWLALLVIVFMAGILAHAVHLFFWGPFIVVPASIAVAMFVGPVISITTVTVMIAVGAFRRSREEDVGPVGAATLAAEGAKLLTA